jgi:UDP-N-acetylmuramyl pentapeptide phosphotransferase/UDP-N-acetylglucosamine-1-phosphate transferase
MSGHTAASLASIGAAIFVAAAAACFVLLVLLLPLLRRYALAHPVARSSHKLATPQGAGVGVVAATIGTATVACALIGIADDSLWYVFGATLFIAVVGAADDVTPIPVLPRLVLQALAVGIVLVALPADVRLLPALPHWLELLLLGVALVWFVNLVNFMDGIDWITAAEVVPVTAGLIVIGAAGGLPAAEIVVALALCGAVAGFAPFNRPIARVFLGDVGSLAIGLVLGWLLVGLAGRGHIAAAILLPLYYLADTTITMGRRLARGETIWQAHRTHFYQRAVERGSTVMSVVRGVFAVNVALAALAVVSVVWSGVLVQLITLACGAAVVGWLLLSLSGRQNHRSA